MYNGSHSRSSFPLDKMIPKMPKKVKVIHDDYVTFDGYGSLSRQLEKNMHKKKQRLYNKKVSQEF